MSDPSISDTIPPLHPGEVLREEFLIPLGLSQRGLAKASGGSRTRIGHLCHNRSSVDVAVAYRLSRILGTTPEFWLRIQMRYDLDMARSSVGDAIEAEITPFVHPAR